MKNREEREREKRRTESRRCDKDRKRVGEERKAASEGEREKRKIQGELETDRILIILTVVLPFL